MCVSCLFFCPLEVLGDTSKSWPWSRVSTTSCWDVLALPRLLLCPGEAQERNTGRGSHEIPHPHVRISRVLSSTNSNDCYFAAESGRVRSTLSSREFSG